MSFLVTMLIEITRDMRPFLVILFAVMSCTMYVQQDPIALERDPIPLQWDPISLERGPITLSRRSCAAASCPR